MAKSASSPASAVISMGTGRTLTLVTEREFSQSNYGELVESADTVSIPRALESAEAFFKRGTNNPINAANYTTTIRLDSNIFLPQHRPLLQVIDIIALDPFRYNILSSTYTVHPTHIEFTDIVHTGEQISVTYRAGYEEVPFDVKQAIFTQAALHMFTDFELLGAGDSKQPGIQYMRDYVEQVMSTYRLGALLHV